MHPQYNAWNVRTDAPGTLAHGKMLDDFRRKRGGAVVVAGGVLGEFATMGSHFYFGKAVDPANPATSYPKPWSFTKSASAVQDYMRIYSGAADAFINTPAGYNAAAKVRKPLTHLQRGALGG